MNSSKVFVQMQTTNRLISFFLNHPEYFRMVVSQYYPFSKDQLTRHKNFLDWNKVSKNENIVWSSAIVNSFSESISWPIFTYNPSAFPDIAMLDEFSDKIDWLGGEDVCGDSIASNDGIYWNMPLIDKYENRIDFAKLSLNTNVQWSDEVLERYNDRWFKSDLGMNESIPWSLGLFDKFLGKEYLEYFCIMSNPKIIRNIDLLEKYQDIVDWYLVCLNSDLPWIEQNLLERWKSRLDWRGIAQNNTLFRSDPGFFAKHMNKWSQNNYENFRFLSNNESLPWSIPFIEQYAKYWDWDDISTNEGIPWSYELISHFSERLAWGGWSPCFDSSVPFNNNCKDFQLGIVTNEAIPWSIELLEKFNHKIEFSALLENSSVWEKAFKPYLSDEIIDTVIRIIN